MSNSLAFALLAKLNDSRDYLSGIGKTLKFFLVTTFLV